MIDAPRYFKSEVNRFILDTTLRFGNGFKFDYSDYIDGKTKDEDAFIFCNLYFMDYIGSNIENIVFHNGLTRKFHEKYPDYLITHTVEFEHDILSVECKMHYVKYANRLTMSTYKVGISA